MVAAAFAALVLLVVAGVAALVAFRSGAIDDLDVTDVEQTIDDLDDVLDRLPSLTTTTSTTLVPPTTEPVPDPTTTTTTTTSTPQYTSRSGDVGDTLTLGDRNDNPISVAVVGLQDPGAPRIGETTRAIGLFVTYAFHGTEAASASPAPTSVPAGFVLHDQLGRRHAPAAPTDSCDGSLPAEVIPDVPVSTCVPFLVPGTLEVFAIEWYLAGGDGAPAPGDLSWVNR